MAEGRGLDPQCLRIQSASDGCRPPGRLTFRLADGGRTRSPCLVTPFLVTPALVTSALAAPSVFKTAPATRPVHHPFGHHGGTRTRNLRLRRATRRPLRHVMSLLFGASVPVEIIDPRVSSAKPREARCSLEGLSPGPDCRPLARPICPAHN